jgi:hypothetical protein
MLVAVKQYYEDHLAHLKPFIPGSLRSHKVEAAVSGVTAAAAARGSAECQAGTSWLLTGCCWVSIQEQSMVTLGICSVT